MLQLIKVIIYFNKYTKGKSFMSKFDKQINIFLASSLVEFKNERSELVLFIRDLSDKFEENYNIKIKPIYCESIDPCMEKGRKQDCYNEEIENSEMVFFLFFTRAGEYTIEEFKIAYNHFKNSENHKPKIYVYFKNLPEGASAHDSIKEFAKEIDKTYGHYYGTFDSIDTIKLRILLNLKIQEMDFVKIEMKDNVCLVDGKPFVNLDNVAEFANNQDLKQLQVELSNIEEKYFEMKPLYESNKMNDTFYKEYCEIAIKRQSLLDTIDELKKNIFDLSLRLSKDEVRCDLTPRMKQAYRLLEKGDSKGCLTILDEKEIDDDFKRWEKEQERQGKIKATIYVKEHILAIDILQTMYAYKNRFTEIESRYEKIIKTAEKYQVELDVLYDYAFYLHNQNNHSKAIEIAEQLLPYWDNEDISEYDRAMLYNLLAILYENTQRYDLAKELHKKAIEIYEQLVDTNPQAYEPNLAISYNNLANLYKHIQKYDLAESLYKKAIEIRERLVDSNPQSYEPDLADSYNNLAVLYYDTQSFDLAEELHKKAIKIRARLVKENPQVYEPNLASSHNNLANLYSDTLRYDLAEELYKKAIETRERLVVINPQAYEPDLADSYNNLAVLYYDTQRFDLAEDLYKKTIEIRERLAKENPQAYEPNLATIYNNLGLLYSDTQWFDLAEELHKKTIEIRERLVKENPQVYEPDLAMSYNNLAILYNIIQRYDLAEELYEKSIEIRERLVVINPQAFEPYLAKSYNNLANLYSDTQRYHLAEKLYKKTIEIRERLVVINPQTFEPYLASSYNNLANLYGDIEIYALYEEFLFKAFNSAKKYKDSNSTCKAIYEDLEILFEE